MMFQAALVATSLLVAPVQKWEDPVERISEVEGVSGYEQRLGDRKSAVFHDGDVLTFVMRSAAEKVGLTNSLRIGLQKVEGKDLYIGQARIPRSEELVLSYAFTEGNENGWANLVRYSGKKGPEIPKVVENLEGQHVTHELDSAALGEKRTIEIYVPKTDQKNLPVVYLTDGQAVPGYMKEVEWLIKNRKIEPVILVGMHSGGYRGDRSKEHSIEDDFRALEYLKGVGSDRYGMHMKFLCDEVMGYVEKNYPASQARKDRALTGYSNGGAYVVTASVDRPDVFGSVFAYSVAFFIREALEEDAKKKTLPSYSFASGNLEQFIVGTRDSERILREAGAATRNVEYVAGHDSLLWKIALMDDLQRTFPFEK